MATILGENAVLKQFICGGSVDIVLNTKGRLFSAGVGEVDVPMGRGSKGWTGPEKMDRLMP